MKKRILIMTLVLVIALTMTAVPALAASKQVVQVSEKYYEYDEEGDGYFLFSEWEKTFTKGYLTNYDYSYYDRDTEDPTLIVGENNNETIYSYNSKGLLKTSKYKYNGKTDSVTNYTYKGKNVKTMITKRQDVNESKVIYTYDSKGRQSSVTYYYFEDGEWDKSSTYKYTYDKKGRIKKEDYYSKDNEQDFGLTIRTVYTYKKGINTEKLYRSDGTLFQSITNTLDTKGRITKRVCRSSLDSYGGDEWIKDTTKYTYYSNGRTKTIKASDNEGNVSLFTYRKDGQLKSMTQTSDGYEHNTRNYFNDKGLTIKSVTKNHSEYVDDEGNAQAEDTEYVVNYEYEGYYRDKYPKVIYTYENGSLQSMEKRTYKYFVDRTPEEAMEAIGRGE